MLNKFKFYIFFYVSFIFFNHIFTKIGGLPFILPNASCTVKSPSQISRKWDNKVFDYVLFNEPTTVSCVASLSFTNSPMASWDSKVPILCTVYNVSESSRSSGYFCLLFNKYCSVILLVTYVFSPTPLFLT